VLGVGAVALWLWLPLVAAALGVRWALAQQREMEPEVCCIIGHRPRWCLIAWAWESIADRPACPALVHPDHGPHTASPPAGH